MQKGLGSGKRWLSAESIFDIARSGILGMPHVRLKHTQTIPRTQRAVQPESICVELKEIGRDTLPVNRHTHSFVLLIQTWPQVPRKMRFLFPVLGMCAPHTAEYAQCFLEWPLCADVMGEAGKRQYQVPSEGHWLEVGGET